MALSNSIVDYLNQRGQGSSYAARKQLANQMGMTGYSGTASQNISLLNQLRNGGGNNNPSANVMAGVNQQAPTPVNPPAQNVTTSTSESGKVSYPTRGYTPSEQVDKAYKAYTARLGSMPGDYSESEYVDARREQLKNVEGERPDPFKSKYEAQISSLLDGIYGEKKFSYTGKDLQNDDLYKMYAQRYTDSARRAMQDTMANAQAQSGGYGSTYAQQVGQQAYDTTMGGLNDKALEFRDKAYQMYRDDRANRYNQLQAFQGQDNTDYSRYRDTVSDWMNDRNYYLNALNGEMANDLNVYNANTSNYWNGTNHLAGQYNADRSADLSAYQHDKAEEQWAKEYAMKKEAQELDNELSRLNIEKTKQALAQMALGGAGGGGGGRSGGGGRGGRRGRKGKQTEVKTASPVKVETGKTGKQVRNAFDLMDAFAPYFNKGANNVAARPNPAITPQNALKEIYAHDGVDYDLDITPDDPLTYITRNELRKAREKRGY